MTVLAVLALALAAAAWVRPRPRAPAGGPDASSASLNGSAPGLSPGPSLRRVDVALLARVAVGVGVFAIFPGVPGLAVGLAVLVWGGRLLARWEPGAARRRRLELESLVPLSVDLLSVALRAGASTQGALRDVAAAVPSPLAEELAAVVRRLEIGTDPVLVWEELAKHPQLGPLGRTLLRCSRSGASVATALARQAEEQWAARRAQVEAQARAVDARASLPLGLCLLPAFVLLGVVPMIAEGFAHGLLPR
ncbi:MAG: type II secretion system F family protein [Nocardioidaceae bacterium]